VSRIIVAGLFIVAVLVGFVLAAFGVPSEVAIASGLIVTGVVLLVVGGREEWRGRVPVNLRVVGGVFVAIGALLFAVGLTMDDDEDDTRAAVPTRPTAV
jgi:hypothetical protein